MILTNILIPADRIDRQYGLVVLGARRGTRQLEPEEEMEFGDSFLVRGTWEAIGSLQGAVEDVVVVGCPEEVASQVTELSGHSFAAIAILAGMVVLMVSAAGVFAGLNTMYGAIVGRVRELAALQTIGFRRRAIVASLIQEGTVLAIAASLTGTANAISTPSGRSCSRTRHKLRVRPLLARNRRKQQRCGRSAHPPNADIQIGMAASTPNPSG